MKKVLLYIILLFVQLSVQAQLKTAEDYYVSAFNEMSDMLAGRDSLSIKRAVFLAEWAYLEGNIPFINTGANHGPKTVVPQPSFLPSFR